ncbi:hypothetical protein DPMN_178072 [Dreissena polymorpha]|uniref:Uncharacterized protein n=1 Tax=Dreissena polymorpha TaxID=45954 RepID=A0A9D4EBC5_DREPO|nr:hypothetical protein DPMN_178072 [Dreissena polymorpha]
MCDTCSARPNKAFMITWLVSSRVVQRTSKQGLHDHTASQFEGRAAHVQTRPSG